MHQSTPKIRKWWQQPWSYKESFAIVSGLMLIGFILQLTTGSFQFLLLQSPVNWILIIALIIIVTILAFFHRQFWIQWLSGVPFSIAVISGLLAFSLIMGLIPQIGPNSHSHSVLAFDNITSNWSFILLYFSCLLSLGALITRRLIYFNWKDYAFHLNHIGLWLVLVSLGFGTADMKRYVMHVEEGEIEWRVYSENGDILELPIAIKLNDFYMEEYIPKLAIIDRETGNAIPANKPQYLQIDTVKKTGRIENWEIRIHNYIHDAIRKSDSTFRFVPMPGSCPAVEITARSTIDGTIKEGWISCGNFAQLYMTLILSDHTMLVMTRPEPKLFMSDITVYTQSEKSANRKLAVNKPFRIDDWMIYQYSYNADMGKASTTSSFELVYDPWLPLSYVGFVLFILGSLALIITGTQKKKGLTL